jgi:hypothetical protein
LFSIENIVTTGTPYASTSCSNRWLDAELTDVNVQAGFENEVRYRDPYFNDTHMEIEVDTDDEITFNQTYEIEFFNRFNPWQGSVKLIFYVQVICDGIINHNPILDTYLFWLNPMVTPWEEDMYDGGDYEFQGSKEEWDGCEVIDYRQVDPSGNDLVSANYTLYR